MKFCVVESCSGQTGINGTARGLCRKHYHRYQRYKDVNVVRRVNNYKNINCLVEVVILKKEQELIMNILD